MGELNLKRIGVLTSGGDSPGMNTAIRAVTRTAVANGFEVYGIKKGYDGLINNDYLKLNAGDVSDILNKGGTMLHTARSEEMYTEDGRKKAAENYFKMGLSALIVIGGDGSFKGALELSKLGINIMGIPATIDLDINCTEYTIGFDTAVNTGTEALCKLKDTSLSHERCSVVEVMGRQNGSIALWCAIAGGADEALIIEEKNDTTMENLISQILINKEKGRKNNLIVISEGFGNTFEIAKEIEEKTGIQTRTTILGHIQRGGCPTVLDKMRASVMGYKAVTAIINGEKNKVISYVGGEYIYIPLIKVFGSSNKYNQEIYNILKTLSV